MDFIPDFEREEFALKARDGDIIAFAPLNFQFQCESLGTEGQ